jgi:hypothetical protein
MADAVVGTGLQMEASSTALILSVGKQSLRRGVGFVRWWDFVDEAVPCSMGLDSNLEDVNFEFEILDPVIETL